MRAQDSDPARGAHRTTGVTHTHDALNAADYDGLLHEMNHRLADLAGSLTPEQWTAPSLCDGWRACDALRKLVTFNELNLMGEWPMRRTFQAIFCRNVVIYFEEATQSRVFARFLPFMETDGRLYIGHSERLCGEAAQRFVTDGVTTYRLRSALA